MHLKKFILIYLFQWDETPRSRITVSKGTHIYKVGRSCHIATPYQRRHINVGDDDQPPAFHTDTGMAY